MKDTVIDVLMYLFERYIDDDDDVEPDREESQEGLLAAGFTHGEIEKAFDWLEGLSRFQSREPPEYTASTGIRMYADREADKLDSDCQGFVLFLEQAGVLTPASRELIIDRVMALETDEINLEQLKWIILMVLFNMPGEEAAYNWLEDLVMEDAPTYLH